MAEEQEYYEAAQGDENGQGFQQDTYGTEDGGPGYTGGAGDQQDTGVDETEGGAANEEDDDDDR